jgi:hypothetical protein
MSSTAKKKTGVKERGGVEGTTAVTSVQSAFTSAARATMWHADTTTTTTSGAAAAVATAPCAYTAAINAVCGRPFGAMQLEDPWSHAETVPRVPHTEKLLPSTQRWEQERAVYRRLFTQTPTSSAPAIQPVHEGGDDGDDATPTTTRAADALYEEWLAHVAAHRCSPLLYPHHTLFFDASLMLTPPPPPPSSELVAPTAPSSAFAQVAAVLHRMLAVYLERCCEQHQEGSEEMERRVPSRVFASLLYTSVYNNNFSGPAEEQKDVTFTAAALHGAEALKESAKAPASQAPRLPRRYDAMSVISCLSVSHVCVCVGKHYYKLEVVDEQRGRLRNVAAIAKGLEAIHRHHKELMQVDPLAGVSPMVHRDYDAMQQMFAHLSSLNDDDAFDVRRRLREASAVNAYSLDALQGGLCTLVLQDGCNNDADATEGGQEPPTARWLHSVCSFEVSLHEPSQWVMRLLAAVVPAQAGADWIARATTTAIQPADVASMPSTVPKPLEEEKAAGSGDAVAGAQQSGLYARSNADLCTLLDDEGRAAFLELWLPEKHRIPLRPYPAPQWDPETTQMAIASVSPQNGCTLEQFIVSLLRVIVELKHGNKPFCCPSSTPQGREVEWPCVVLAVQPISGGAPTLVALDSPAIQHYYEVVAAHPRLFSREAKQHIEEEARAEVRAVLNIVWHAAATVRTHPPALTEGVAATSSSLSWWATLEKSPADVCISFSVLPRPTTSSSSAAAVQRVVSSLALSSALLINCTAQQTAAEAHLRASAARVVDAVVQANTPASVEFGKSVCETFAACTQQ